MGIYVCTYSENCQRFVAFGLQIEIGQNMSPKVKGVIKISLCVLNFRRNVCFVIKFNQFKHVMKTAWPGQWGYTLAEYGIHRSTIRSSIKGDFLRWIDSCRVISHGYCRRQPPLSLSFWETPNLSSRLLLVFFY